ncbi:MAG: hypothetical protein KDD42_08355 [Bdellovibrionales bacterium]|nr:hypothetical protein [Bdellovibrionales bacterium]
MKRGFGDREKRAGRAAGKRAFALPAASSGYLERLLFACAWDFVVLELLRGLRLAVEERFTALLFVLLALPLATEFLLAEAVPKGTLRFLYGICLSNTCLNALVVLAAGLNSTDRAVPLTFLLTNTLSRAYFIISGFRVAGFTLSLFCISRTVNHLPTLFVNSRSIFARIVYDMISFSKRKPLDL